MLFLQIFPACYVLMTRKTCNSYCEVFDFIENKLFHLHPSAFMTDFEWGLRNAIEKKYPQAQLRGCWYHFCSALRKNALKHGLFSILKKNPNAKYVLKCLMCLPLLPDNCIQEGYIYIKSIVAKNNLVTPFSQYLNYVESYWLNLQVNNCHISSFD